MRRLPLLIATLCSLATAPLAAAPPAATTRAAQHKPAEPSDTAVPGVRNFAKISDALYRGDQPTAEGFANLKKLGVRTVVNLRTFHSDRPALAGTGLRYVHIHAQAWNVEDKDLARFLKVVTDPANQPVFVHCMQGADRTGLSVAVYRVMEQGWTPEDAATEMTHFRHNRVWRNIRDTLRTLDVDRMRRRVANVAMPRIDTIE
jgi:protein tyrosine/serine phosphatase